MFDLPTLVDQTLLNHIQTHVKHCMLVRHQTSSQASKHTQPAFKLTVASEEATENH